MQPEQHDGSGLGLALAMILTVGGTDQVDYREAKC